MLGQTLISFPTIHSSSNMHSENYPHHLSSVRSSEMASAWQQFLNDAQMKIHKVSYSSRGSFKCNYAMITDHFFLSVNKNWTYKTKSNIWLAALHFKFFSFFFPRKSLTLRGLSEPNSRHTRHCIWLLIQLFTDDAIDNVKFFLWSKIGPWCVFVSAPWSGWHQQWQPWMSN